MAPRTGITSTDTNAFLKDDFYNALRHLFEGAIAWDAWKQGHERTRHQGSLGMYTTFMEARALYDFFHKKEKLDDEDNALADHFASPWRFKESTVFTDYMAHHKPANKRMFHLVYQRSAATHPTGELNEQVLNVAKDILEVATEFVQNINDPAVQSLARASLKNALVEAEKAALDYGIANPL